MDKKQYTGWLTSPDIVKRSFAVMGHYLLAYIMLIGVVLALMLTIGLISFIFTSVINSF